MRGAQGSEGGVQVAAYQVAASLPMRHHLIPGLSAVMLGWSQTVMRH